MLTPKDLSIVIVKVTCIVSLKCKIIFNITNTYITFVICGNVAFLTGTIMLEVAYSMTMVALNIRGATVDVVDDEDGFAAARGAGGVVSEARGGGGGVVDVEGAREVEGVVEK
jgi:hypothetical protein